DLLCVRDLLGGHEVAGRCELHGGAHGIVGLGGGPHALIMLGRMVTGGCLCGGVRYEVTEPLIAMTYCHCRRCQRRTGTAASPQARIEPGSLRFVQGEELVKGWKPPDDGFEKCFCSNCGGQLFSKDADGVIRSVRLGSLDDDP